MTVYCRNPRQKLRQYRGTRLVNLPALRLKSAETLSHTALSVGHAMLDSFDVALVFNSGNAPFVASAAEGVPVAAHRRPEAQRAKWQGLGARYHVGGDPAVRRADAVIADALAIRDYVKERYGRDADYLPYGADIISEEPFRLAGLGLEADRYHLTVARFEPENHVLQIIRGYRATSSELPLVVVGAASYLHAYADEVVAAAERDPSHPPGRVGVGPAVARPSLRGGSQRPARPPVGGTNPSPSSGHVALRRRSRPTTASSTGRSPAATRCGSPTRWGGGGGDG